MINHFTPSFELVDPRVEEYLKALLPEEETVLKEMEQFGESRNFPLVGPLVGRFLNQLATLVGATSIFEMGSGYGYSAYWFAKALSEGQVVLTEGSPELAQKAKAFLKRAGMEKKTKIEVGDALEIIDRYQGPFDLIFIDIDKEDYPKAFHKALPKLKQGGALVADNVLWFGRVISGDQDETTKGIREFTRLIYQTPGLRTTIVPLRDGVSISLKT